MVKVKEGFGHLVTIFLGTFFGRARFENSRGLLQLAVNLVLRSDRHVVELFQIVPGRLAAA